MKLSEKAEEMLRADLDNENDTVRNYRQRVAQCEAMGEYGIAEDIREILRQEQEHQIDLATALGEDVPDLSTAQEEVAASAPRWATALPAVDASARQATGSPSAGVGGPAGWCRRHADLRAVHRSVPAAARGRRASPVTL